MNRPWESRLDHWASRFLCGFGLVLVLFGALFLARRLALEPPPLEIVVVCVILVLAGIFLVFLGRWLPPGRRTSWALAFFLFLPGLYVVEALLGHEPLALIDQRKQSAAQAFGRSFDTRSPVQVIGALRSQGIEAYPALFPRKLLQDQQGRLDSPIILNGRQVAVLSGIPQVTTVHCNESGAYSIYESDERGFRNPTGLWAQPRLDLALLGDSFLQGDCVQNGEDVASRLRQAWPLTVTLGMRNNGPLIELAGLREYLTLRRPRRVVWFFYEGNDLEDLASESGSPLLMRYLAESDFRQGLDGLNSQLALALRKYFDSFLPAQIDQAPSSRPQSFLDRFADWVLLRSLRSLLGLSLSGQAIDRHQFLSRRLPTLAGLLSTKQSRPASEAILQDRFESILGAARASIEGWKGDFMLVYLPDPLRFCSRIATWREKCPAKIDLSPLEARRKAIADMARRQGVTMLDLAEELTHHDEVEHYYLYYGSHHSARGYAWLAGRVREELEQGR